MSEQVLVYARDPYYRSPFIGLSQRGQYGFESAEGVDYGYAFDFILTYTWSIYSYYSDAQHPPVNRKLIYPIENDEQGDYFENIRNADPDLLRPEKKRNLSIYDDKPVHVKEIDNNTPHFLQPTPRNFDFVDWIIAAEPSYSSSSSSDESESESESENEYSDYSFLEASTHEEEDKDER